jgi:hypothetical protein
VLAGHRAFEMGDECRSLGRQIVIVLQGSLRLGMQTLQKLQTPQCNSPPRTTGKCKLSRSRFSPEPENTTKPLAAAMHTRRQGRRGRRRHETLPHRAVVELDSEAVRGKYRALVIILGVDVARIIDPGA